MTPLPPHLQAIFDGLSAHDLRRLAQEVLDEMTPAIYQAGFRDGMANAEKERERSRAKNATRQRKGRESLPYVYFIRSPDAIKIGTTYNPRMRLKTLQTSHPAKLELAATLLGAEDVEREYHSRFAAHHVSGEWFEPHPDLLAEIDRLNSLPSEGKTK